MPIKQPTYGFAAVDKKDGTIELRSCQPTREGVTKWMDINTYPLWKRVYQIRQVIVVLK